MEKLLTVADLAEVCGVPKGTVYKWNHTGDGPPVTRCGRHARYRPRDVEAWLDRQSQGVGSNRSSRASVVGLVRK